MNWSRVYCFFLLLSLFSTRASTQDVAIGKWRVHIPYNSALTSADGGDKIYCGTSLAMFIYDKQDHSIEVLNKVNGLSDIGVSTLNYYSDKNLLLIAYENSNLDLIVDGIVTNISDIERKNLVGDKKIYDICFIGNYAYLSCGFGIVVLDLGRHEIKDTYYIGPLGDFIRVNEVASDGSKIFAATEIGIFEADLSNPLLTNPASWKQHTPSDGISTANCADILYQSGNFYSLSRDSIYKYEGGNWAYYYNESTRNIISMNSGNSKLAICETSDTSGNSGPRVVIIDSTKSKTIIQNSQFIIEPSHAFEDNNGVAWISDSYTGLIKVENSSLDRIVPNGPASMNIHEILIDNNEVWVAPGGVHIDWTFTYNRDGFFSFIGDWWSATADYNNPQLDTLLDFITVAKDPSNNHVYMGSYGGGLVEFFDNEIINIYERNNSSLQKTEGDNTSVRVSGLAFDENNNLWISNFGAVNPICVKHNNGSWYSFSPPGSLDIGDSFLGPIIIDDVGQIWIILPKGKGILVYNHGESISGTNDDKYKSLKTGESTGNLPDVNVLCIAKDLEGEIWVGTKQGIGVFYCPSEVFSQGGCDADRIFVTQDGYGAYLMETEFVNTIAVDGANRKWIGTNNGVWLMSEDGTSQIQHFNTENSPILSNIIIDIAINHETGEVFIGTDKGIISYKSTATEGFDTHKNVLVYPNPVKEHYSGTIAIKGLVNNAYVKITDISGKLIYQTQALGGQAIWNGYDYNSKKASTGVYLVFSTNSDGSETFVAKFLIIN